MIETKQMNVLVRLPDVVRILKISRSGLYQRLQKTSRYYDETFPKPIKLAPGPRGAVAWPLAELMDWINSRLKDRKN